MAGGCCWQSAHARDSWGGQQASSFAMPDPSSVFECVKVRQAKNVFRAEMNRLSHALLIAGLLMACGQKDVAPVQIDWCRAARGAEAASPDEAAKKAIEYHKRVSEERKRWLQESYAPWDLSQYALDCKTGHLVVFHNG